MRDIYSDSTVTILAPRASNVNQGFLYGCEALFKYRITFKLLYICLDNRLRGSVVLYKRKRRSVNTIAAEDPLD